MRLRVVWAEEKGRRHLHHASANRTGYTPAARGRLLKTFLVKPRWLVLKIHTNAGIVGLGERVVEGRTLTCQTAAKEVAPYLVGRDPRAVVHRWQAASVCAPKLL